jgi:mRNA interferase RelE/StbE
MKLWRTLKVGARPGLFVVRVESNSYSVYTTSRADRQLERLDIEVHDRVLSVILALGDGSHPVGSAKLKGRDGYRVRIGDYRALYLVDAEAREVTVYRVAHRREVYR